MNNYNYSYVLVAVLLLALTGCEYSPPDIPLTGLENPVERPELTDILIPQDDTIRVAAYTDFTYRVKNYSSDVFRIEIFIDGEQYDYPWTNKSEIVFQLRPSEIKTGEHELMIKTYTRSGTGSISDELGLEHRVYEHKWPLIINPTGSKEFDIKSIEVTPEGLKFDWSKYNYMNFSYYTLDCSLRDRRIISREFSNRNQTSHIVQNYVEGYHYQGTLGVHYNYGRVVSKNFTYYKELPAPEVEIDENRNVSASWPKTNFQKNVRSYFLRMFSPEYDLSNNIEIEDLEQTSYKFDRSIGFGEDYTIQYQYTPIIIEGDPAYLRDGISSSKFAVGNAMPEFQIANYIPSENSLLLENKGVITKYNLDNNESFRFNNDTIDDIGWFHTSPNGELLAYTENRQLVVRNSNNFSIVRRMKIDPFFDNTWPGKDISISNNGVIAVLTPFNNLCIYNVFTAEKLFEKTFSSTLQLNNIRFSPDGSKLAILLVDQKAERKQLVFYNYSNNELSEIRRLEYYYAFDRFAWGFSPEEQHAFTFVHYDLNYQFHLEYINSNTFEHINTVNIPAEFTPVAFNYDTNQLIIQSITYPENNTHSYLMNVQTRALKKATKIVGRRKFIFASGKVCSGNGRWLNIDDF
ncbi:hypothetical protein EYV94_12910 [Puteibacter caeruleilacunae]|nr:hypothetical protein EYV94_12910 [Puteibacter caeruleilacunae]